MHTEVHTGEGDEDDDDDTGDTQPILTGEEGDGTEGACHILGMARGD